MSHGFYYVSRPEAVLKVTGEDSPGYLQSQFSNDLRAPASECPVSYGLWLDRKGKVRADSFILRLEEEAFLLVSYYCRTEMLRAIVEENIIADDVEVEDLSANASLFSCWGPQAERAFGNAHLAAASYTKQGHSLLFKGRRSCQPCLEWLQLDGELDPQSYFDEGNWVEADMAKVEKERIISNIPRIPLDIGPSDLPQEAGLEKVAVHFNKGCYLGQEVMARLHAMGKVNRVLSRVEWVGELPKLPVSIQSEDKVVGEVRSAIPTEDKVQGLALIKRRALDDDRDFALTAGQSVKLLTDA